MRSRSTATAIFTAFAAVAFVASPVFGQDPVPAPPELPELTDERLVAFAEAHLDVADIMERLEAAILDARDEEEAEQLRAHGRHEVEEAVEQWGFTLEVYTAITAALNEDEALRERFEPILARVREERAERDT